MSYRVGWGANARHFAVTVETAKEAQAAADSMQRYCQNGVVVVNDRIGVVDVSSLRHLIAAEQAPDLAEADAACAICEPGGSLDFEGVPVCSVDRHP